MAVEMGYSVSQWTVLPPHYCMAAPDGFPLRPDLLSLGFVQPGDGCHWHGVCLQSNQATGRQPIPWTILWFMSSQE